MNTAIVKPSNAIKGSTSTVRAHLDAVQRATEIYQNQIKRAETEYFDRIRRAATIFTGDEEPAATTANDATVQTEATIPA